MVLFNLSLKEKVNVVIFRAKSINEKTGSRTKVRESNVGDGKRFYFILDCLLVVMYENQIILLPSFVLSQICVRGRCLVTFWRELESRMFESRHQLPIFPFFRRCGYV